MYCIFRDGLCKWLRCIFPDNPFRWLTLLTCPSGFQCLWIFFSRNFSDRHFQYLLDHCLLILSLKDKNDHKRTVTGKNNTRLKNHWIVCGLIYCTLNFLLLSKGSMVVHWLASLPGFLPQSKDMRITTLNCPWEWIYVYLCFSLAVD